MVEAVLDFVVCSAYKGSISAHQTAHIRMLVTGNGCIVAAIGHQGNHGFAYQTTDVIVDGHIIDGGTFNSSISIARRDRIIVGIGDQRARAAENVRQVHILQGQVLDLGMVGIGEKAAESCIALREASDAFAIAVIDTAERRLHSTDTLPVGFTGNINIVTSGLLAEGNLFGTGGHHHGGAVVVVFEGFARVHTVAQGFQVSQVGHQQFASHGNLLVQHNLFLIAVAGGSHHRGTGHRRSGDRGGLCVAAAAAQSRDQVAVFGPGHTAVAARDGEIGGHRIHIVSGGQGQRHGGHNHGAGGVEPLDARIHTLGIDPIGCTQLALQGGAQHFRGIFCNSISRCIDLRKHLFVIKVCITRISTVV